MDSGTWNFVANAVKKDDDTNPLKWLAESAEFGRSYVYTPDVLDAVEAAAKSGQKMEALNLSDEYLKAAGRVARNQAAFAAQRLAVVLKEGMSQ